MLSGPFTSLYPAVDDSVLKLKSWFSSAARTLWPGKDLLEFDAAYERMMSWLGQKEKMASLLVPVGCELSVLANQLSQTRVGLPFCTISTNSCSVISAYQSACFIEQLDMQS